MIIIELWNKVAVTFITTTTGVYYF